MEELVIKATENFTKILATSEIKDKYKELDWGGNGGGDRWVDLLILNQLNYQILFFKYSIPSIF